MIWFSTTGPPGLGGVPAGAIAGGVIGGLIGLAIVILIIIGIAYLVWRWKDSASECNHCYNCSSCSAHMYVLYVHIVGNFQGRKLLQISQFCGYLWKFSLQNLGAWHPLVWQKSVICRSFLHENRIFHQFTKVSCYTVCKIIVQSTCVVQSLKICVWSNSTPG